MGTVNITYAAKSLGDVAAHFEAKAAEHRDCATAATRKIDKARWEGKAQAMDMAADILRNTTLKAKE